MKNLLKLSDFDVEYIKYLLQEAEKCESGKYDSSLEGKIIANLFFEPSTRTHYSFQMAENRLGMRVLNFNPSVSSMKKGESFYDTVKTFSMMNPDAIVIRSQENEYYNQLLGHVNMPLINAGDGTKDHPTQSLLDLLTIKQEFGDFEGLKIAIVGDIKHSRVAHTNIEVMKRLGMDCYIAGPKEYDDPEFNHMDFDRAVEEMDIIMLLRIQHERHMDEMNMTIEEYHENFGMNSKRVEKMKDRAIIMHPAPFNRGVEISDDLVECEKSRIFKQIHNGVLVRMAVIHELLKD